MIDRPWLLHPAVVHFPVALLLTGLFINLLPAKQRGGAGVESVVRTLLYLGTVSAWAAFFLGKLAEDTAPHVPAAWKMLNEHESLATWTVWLFTALCAARFVLDRRKADRKSEAAFLIGWLLAAGVLAAAAWHGGELVYAFNVGTAASEAE